jgi:uncharacterized membrane protein YphA (DoxX/SURF4 family)
VKDVQRISVLAIILLVVLRISIGWQFLYEGLWKLSTLNGPNPWSAEGYLKQSQGPFRDKFVEMAGGDPYDLDWLDHDQVSAQWSEYLDRFKSHYGLTETQLTTLAKIENGPETYSVDLAKLPEVLTADGGANRKWASLSATIWYDEDAKKLMVSGSRPITPREVADLQALVNVVKTADGQYAMKGADGEPVMLGPDGERLLLDPNGVPARLDADGLPDPEQEVSDWRYQPPDETERVFYIRLENLLTQCSRGLGYRQKLAALLRGDPELVGVWWKFDEATERGETVMADGEWNPTEGPLLQFGKIQEYRDTVEQYEAAIENAETTGLAHYYEHADRLKAKFQAQRSEVVGPVLALDAEFHEKVFDLLDVEQLQRPPLPPEDTPGYRASMQAMWGLLILGPLLILGLFTRVAALAGAVMVLSFYLVIPPWPGVPPELALPEHSFVVNKNLIEALALLGLAAVPSGTWFGLDGLLGRIGKSLTGRRAQNEQPAAKTAGSSSPSATVPQGTASTKPTSPPTTRK